MIKTMVRSFAVLAAVLCLAACDTHADARYDLSESDIVVWEHARNPSGDDVIIVTLSSQAAAAFNLFTQAQVGKTVDIYLGQTLLSSPEIRSVSTSDQMYLTGFEGEAFDQMKTALPPSKRKTD